MPTSASLLPVAINQTALALAQTLFGDGITIVSASYQGDARSAGIYTSGETVSPDAVPSASGVILSTGLATDFTNDSGLANQSSSTTTDTTGANNDTGMNAVAGMSTFDAAVFDAQFTSTGDELTMRLVFGSEEYLEFVNSGYNDAVGIWVNGQRVSLSLGDGTISIDNINDVSNQNLFRDNTSGIFNTEMDGVTRVLTLKAPLLIGQVNTIRIAIADAGDAAYDSALLIVADSVQSALIAQDDAVSVTGFGHVSVDLVANDTTAGRSGVHVSHINDVAVTAGGVVALANGDAVRLEADSRVTVLSGGLNGDVNFSYTITDAAGVADTAFVTVTPQAVDGTAGNDSMLVNFRDVEGNIIDGTDGAAEAIFGYGGNDKIFAGLGDDQIYGGTGNDFMRAGAGNDKMVGGDGGDVLDGETGADTMEGGLGNDVYYIDDAGDVVIEAANSGYDKLWTSLSIELASTLEELWMKQDSAATVGTGNALDNKMVGNGNANTLTGEAGKDQLFGKGGNDTLNGGDDNDMLYGDGGADLIIGGAGADKLFGSTGADTLYGGDGADKMVAGDGGGWMDGGTGNDFLTAGSGADVFHFAIGSGKDVIRGFDAATDTLVFDLAPQDLTFKHLGTRTVISWGTDDQVTVKGWLSEGLVEDMPITFLL